MNIRELSQQLRDYAGFWPGIVVSLVVSFVACGYVSRVVGISKAHGWALVMSLGVILAATITPSREALLFGATGTGTCDFSSVGPGTLWDLRHLDEATLNILLFVPLGIALGLCPRSPVRTGLVAVALVLPIAIEWTQLVVVSLDRQCQSSDVVDNVLGLLAGIVLGAVIGRALSQRGADRVHDEREVPR